MKRADSGFTLIELMVVVVIAGILAAIAYPAYTESVRKSRRAAAKTTVLQIAQQEERYYTENNKYVVLTGLGYASSTVNSNNNGHAVTIAAGSSGSIDTSYVITAAPLISDSVCGSLTLTQTGVWANSAGAPARSC